MSAAHTPMTLGDLVHVRVDGHNEPIAMLPIVTAERMNAGSGIALVAYRQPDDRAMAQCMAAAPELLEALMRMVEMIDFHHTDGQLPDNEAHVPMEMARAAIDKACGGAQ